MGVLPQGIAWWKRRYPAHFIDRSVVYLMGLLSAVDESVVKGVVARLMLSNDLARKVRFTGPRLGEIVRRLTEKEDLRPSTVYHLLNPLPNEALVLLLAMSMAESKRMVRRTKQWLSTLVIQLREVKTSLRGMDLLQMGLKPGPRIKELLTRLHDARLDGTIGSKAEEKAFIRAALTADRS